MSDVGKSVLESMRRSYRRASAAYQTGARNAARYWLGGCAALRALSDDLGDELSDAQLRQMAEFSARARALFEEEEMGKDAYQQNPKRRPDPAVAALDAYLAENGV
jgi:hypothetical protein